MTEPVWIDERAARAIHNLLILRHGGPAGIRDDGLLQSALARPRQVAAYSETADVIALAAAYSYAIARNHPFVDGNKRTAFVLGVLFLELNGWRFTAAEQEAIAAVQALAAGDLDEAAYAAFLRANVRPA